MYNSIDQIEKEFSRAHAKFSLDVSQVLFSQDLKTNKENSAWALLSNPIPCSARYFSRLIRDIFRAQQSVGLQRAVDPGHGKQFCGIVIKN
jgi:hypothetical protein